MTHSIVRSIVSGLIALSIAHAPELRAQQGRTLPSFALTTAAGAPASSDALARDGAWVLIVAQMPCRACDAAFSAIDQALTFAHRERVTVIVSAVSSAQLAALRSGLVQLSGAGWYLDEARAALGAIGASGAPVVVGLRGNRVMWSRNAAGMNAAAVQSLVTSWIR
ncbi:MAG: hypothetical protein K2Y23_13035 [Cyanobacteria bacterium]|nr:hypothetical protein [Cyanobacteriota bacterium]